MIAKLRKEFNATFSQQRYEQVAKILEEASGCEIGFRIAETPLFLSREVAHRAARLAEEILLRAVTPELQKIGEQAIPTQWHFAGETDKPLFAAVDFAITGSSTSPQFKLIELQGFPSLFHYQGIFSETMRDVYEFPKAMNGLFDPTIGVDTYYDILRTAIVGSQDPKDVALVEIDPHHQKTRCDFYLAAKRLGIRIVDIRSIVAKENLLYSQESDGALLPIKRIYNRAIVDELERRNITLQFDIHKKYDVEWAGHPNWYFRISKVLLPHLVGTNEAVPNAWYLDKADYKSLDLSEFVLKPLFSFAGVGVNINPTIADIEAIPPEQRHQWLLQEKVEYAEVIHTPDGNGVRAELRALMVWLPSDAKPKALHTLVRLTRGKMVGVDFNKGLDWVGSSCGLVQ